jgi:hypothetical protein
LALCISIALADATSGGQEVCAIPAVAEREKTVRTLNTTARSFLIVSVLSDCILAVFRTGSFLLALGAPLAALWCTGDARGHHRLKYQYFPLVM